MVWKWESYKTGRTNLSRAAMQSDLQVCPEYLLNWKQIVFDAEIIALNIQQEAELFLRTELAKSTPSDRRRLIEKFVLAALGSVPWIGGFLSAAATFKIDQDALRESSNDPYVRSLTAPNPEAAGPLISPHRETSPIAQPSHATRTN